MRKIIHIFFIAMIFCIGISSVFAQNNKLTNYVVGNGAAIVRSGGHVLSLTIGQPIVGKTSNALHSYNIGFWYQYAETIVGVEEDWRGGTPLEFELFQNYPNPFNPTTIIRYGLPKESSVKVIVYNILGEIVNTLVDNVQKSGYYEVNFNASNLATGIYIYRIQAGDFVETKKMVLLR